jgi:Dullard-like phosphatase family protein
MRATNEINEEESQKYTNPIVSVGIFDDDSLNESFSPKSGKDSKMKKNLTKSITGSMVEMVFDFPIIDSSFNYAGNYQNYVTNTLTSIILIKQFLQNQNSDFQKGKNEKKIKDEKEENIEKEKNNNNNLKYNQNNYNINNNNNNINNDNINNDNNNNNDIINEKNSNNHNIEMNNNNEKKILVLDLDETLIHSDFEGKFKLLNNYDGIINFNDDNNINYSVGIYLRPGLFDFLKIAKEKFDLYIYTASTINYCNSIINLIDPERNIFKEILFRNDCLNINNQIFIKDISIFQNMENVIIVDNSLYSFMNQISNGILINSFYGDKSDMELLNVLNYLIGFLSNAQDVRKVNEHFFNFKSIMEEIEKNLLSNVPSNVLMNV